MDDELGKDSDKAKDEEEIAASRQGPSETRADAAELRKVPSRGGQRKAEVPKVHQDVAKNNCVPCTVKEIIDEILDCRVVRIPAKEKQATDLWVDKGSQAESETVPSDANDAPHNMVTVKQILGEVLNYTLCHPQAAPPEPGTSARMDFQVFRGETIPAELLPSYSSVLRMGPRKTAKASSVDLLVSRRPPPSYAEVEGLWDAASPSAASSESAILGPDPLYVVCPVCRTVVVTDVERERSNATHILALVLCLFLCWPCCLLPYCMHSCSYSYHSCPHCRHYFGMYRPF